MASSYVLLYENSKNPNQLCQMMIRGFIKSNIATYIDVDRASEVKAKADPIISTGVKTADAHHVACAILSGSDYFITTDDRLLKYKSDDVKIMDPVEFIREWEGLL